MPRPRSDRSAGAHPPGRNASRCSRARVRTCARFARRWRRATLPFIGVNLEPLADVAVVRDLEALARALESPLDRVAWLAVLRAPFVGLALPDLTADRGSRARRQRFPRRCATGFRACRRMAMERLIACDSGPAGAPGSEREREPRAHLVERVWLALGGPSACAQSERAREARGASCWRWTRKTASACAAGRSISNASCTGSMHRIRRSPARCH